MKIGFYIHWDTGSLDIKEKRHTIGEELMAIGFCKYLRRYPEVTTAEVYGGKNIPTEKLDIMIYMNETSINQNWAQKNIMYFQNGFDDSIVTLDRIYKQNFDGYMLYSKKYYDYHIQTGRSGIYVPHGVDFAIFKPVPQDVNYTFDVAYVGNDIKGKERTEAYILPATNFNFGLFGYWQYKPLSILKRIKKYLKIKQYTRGQAYQKSLMPFAQGKIAPEDCPKLYSSTPIILNCTLQGAVDQDISTLRTLEVLACGGFLISDFMPSTDTAIKDCVVFSDGHNNLKEKIAYYLAHPEERQRIAQNGYNYACQHGNIEHRVADMLNYFKTLFS